MYYRIHPDQDSTQQRVDMILQLFRYLRKDPYYSILLQENVQAQKCYYKRMLYNDMCLIVKGDEKPKTAPLNERKYREILEASTGYRVLYFCVIGIYRICPLLVRKLYRLGKSRKKRSLNYGQQE